MYNRLILNGVTGDLTTGSTVTNSEFVCVVNSGGTLATLSISDQASGGTVVSSIAVLPSERLEIQKDAAQFLQGGAAFKVTSLMFR
jgi:hypothetical protein